MIFMSELKDLEALHRFFKGVNIDDEAVDFTRASAFEIGLYRIQQAGKRALEEVSEQLQPERGRVKSSKSLLNKLAYLKTPDITTVQDIVAVTMIREDVDSCYQAFQQLLDSGFIPYFKILDTLRTPINNYGSLDTHLRRDGVSFELQIRPPLFDRTYQETHGRYKDKTTATEIDIDMMNAVREQISSLAERDVCALSTYNILILASNSPRMCYQWRTFKVDALIGDMLLSKGVSMPKDVIIPERRVFI